MKRSLALILTVAALAAGCAAPEPWVKPYEREKLADPIMQFERESPEDRQLQHVLENREGSFGGGSVKGGGCGCN